MANIDRHIDVVAKFCCPKRNYSKSRTSTQETGVHVPWEIIFTTSSRDFYQGSCSSYWGFPRLIPGIPGYLTGRQAGPVLLPGDQHSCPMVDNFYHEWSGLLPGVPRLIPGLSTAHAGDPRTSTWEIGRSRTSTWETSIRVPWENIFLL